MPNLATVALDLRQLLADYCAANGSDLRPSVTYRWAPGIHCESIEASIHHGDDDESVAFVGFSSAQNPTAAKIMEAVILDRHNRCRIRSVSAAEIRCADADFADDVKANDADGE